MKTIPRAGRSGEAGHAKLSFGMLVCGARNILKNASKRKKSPIIVTYMGRWKSNPRANMRLAVRNIKMNGSRSEDLFMSPLVIGLYQNDMHTEFMSEKHIRFPNEITYARRSRLAKKVIMLITIQFTITFMVGIPVLGLNLVKASGRSPSLETAAQTLT